MPERTMKERTTYHIEKGDHRFVKAARGFGVRRLAKEVGVSPGMMSMWLSGKVGMSAEKAIRVMQMFWRATGRKVLIQRAQPAWLKADS